MLIVITSGGATSHNPSDGVEKWEYKLISSTTLLDIKSADEAIKQSINTNIIYDPNFEKANQRNLKIQNHLNTLGREGWELVCIDNSSLYHLKRKVN